MADPLFCRHLQEFVGDDGREDVAADGLAVLVDEHAAVGVAVEARPDGCAGLRHKVLDPLQVLLHEWVGLVREAGGVVEQNLLDGQVLLAVENLRHHQAGHAVAGVDGDLDRVGQVEELEDVLLVRRPDVGLLARPLLAGVGAVGELRGDALDVLEAGRLADGLGLGAADLEAVVVGGVVAGGRLHAADGVVVVDGEVDAARVDHAHVDHVHAGGADAVHQGGRKLRRRLAHVSADHQRVLALRPCPSRPGGSVAGRWPWPGRPSTPRRR